MIQYERAIKSAHMCECLSMEHIENSIMRPAQISAMVVLHMYFVKVLSCSHEMKRLIALFSFFFHSLIDTFSALVGSAALTGEGWIGLDSTSCEVFIKLMVIHSNHEAALEHNPVAAISLEFLN